MSELFEVEAARAEYGRSGSFLKYSTQVWHRGLKQHRHVSAKELDVLENKVLALQLKWEEQWERVQDKQKAFDEKEANLQQAEQRTADAKHAHQEVEDLLLHTLSVDDTVDWEALKDRRAFPEPPPPEPPEPKILQAPQKPNQDDPKYQARLNFLDSIFSSLKRKKIDAANALYRQAVDLHRADVKRVEAQNNKARSEYRAVQERWREDVQGWTLRKDEFQKTQDEYNAKIDALHRRYKDGDPEAVLENCELVLNNSEYPDFVSKDFELNYDADTKILVVDYALPPPDAFPTVTEVKYVASRKELKETHLSESKLNKIYDEALYKITLRTIHELFEADKIAALDAISFNGWVTSINKATGAEETSCIVTVQVKQEEFLSVDLARVEPKLCFKKFKGVASSKLAGMTAVQPILQIDKSDRRFVSAHDVANSLDLSTNLASMGWEDFEHLIREVFESEFRTSGGEVKVTRASSDGGVDAVAFDPDPIRGGKIVIQAKRYTNTVGVSAVRDLYGTVMNEGATKGILVTTADYGPDAYEFARAKPLTLLNGSNLLHLLEKHGHRARIDLKEAKQLAKQLGSEKRR